MVIEGGNPGTESGLQAICVFVMRLWSHEFLDRKACTPLTGQVATDRDIFPVREMRLHDSLAISAFSGPEALFRSARNKPDTTPVSLPVEGSNAALALVLMRSLPESICLISAEGRVVFANQPALTRFDQTCGSGANHRKWLELWPDIDNQMLRSAFGAALDGDTTQLTFNSRNDQGRTVSSSMTIAPVEDGSGDISRVLCILRDA